MFKPALVLLALASPVLAAPQMAAPKKQSVAGVDITGLDQTARARRLKRELERRLGTPIVLNAGARRIKRARRDVGVELDMGWMVARASRGDAFVPLKLQVDPTRATAALRRVAPRFAVRPRDARIVNLRRGMKIVPHVTGQALNLGASVPRLARAVEREAGAREVELAVRKQQPRRVTQDFEGITGRLATFSTEYNPGNRTRTTNMVLAARAIDGALVKPAGVFSFNQTVGERTRKRGYQAAIIFENGQKEHGLGGGVSQVTGTLFNAALLAGLPIATYRTHSRPVAYLPIGRDATVSWGNFDMKFKNDTPAPLYITYTVKNGTATASIFGQRTPGQKVRLNVVSKALGLRRIEAKLYRTIRRGGKVAQKQKVGDSSYNWKPDKAD